MARSISKQRWKKVHDYGGNCGPIFLDMACIFGLPNGNNDINVLESINPSYKHVKWGM